MKTTGEKEVLSGTLPAGLERLNRFKQTIIV
jgi:hypothetical protein